MEFEDIEKNLKKYDNNDCDSIEYQKLLEQLSIRNSQISDELLCPTSMYFNTKRSQDLLDESNKYQWFRQYFSNEKKCKRLFSLFQDLFILMDDCKFGSPRLLKPFLFKKRLCFNSNFTVSASLHFRYFALFMQQPENEPNYFNSYTACLEWLQITNKKIMECLLSQMNVIRDNDAMFIRYNLLMGLDERIKELDQFPKFYMEGALTTGVLCQSYVVDLNLVQSYQSENELSEARFPFASVLLTKDEVKVSFYMLEPYLDLKYNYPLDTEFVLLLVRFADLTIALNVFSDIRNGEKE